MDLKGVELTPNRDEFLKRDGRITVQFAEKVIIDEWWWTHDDEQFGDKHYGYNYRNDPGLEIAQSIPDLRDDMDAVCVSTGESTGHVFNCSFTNTSDYTISIEDEYAYIPHTDEYQSYVVRVPGTRIPPGETVSVEITGYCADQGALPVPSNSESTGIDSWVTQSQLPPIEVVQWWAENEIVNTEVDFPVRVVDPLPVPAETKEEPDHRTEQPELATEPQDTAVARAETPAVVSGSDPESGTASYPGTEVPILATVDTEEAVKLTTSVQRGTNLVNIEPTMTPNLFASVAIPIVEKTEEVYPRLVEEGKINTSFSYDQEKEEKIVKQNSIWQRISEITPSDFKITDQDKNLKKQAENVIGSA